MLSSFGKPRPLHFPEISAGEIDRRSCVDLDVAKRCSPTCAKELR